ncbi:hypothetical protein [Novosphingobium cyanobacteriorum]|uniref:Uncharacterized protein n=1 Tax=Novosphingobium cyanobacteriorum TaxID=3024215 RepID=A0ABT6CIL5_9SPHN|nr:hypothetical protein [Novosphingobium cyanobacteriorum]MDF8332910.1 hypothetical protein [Novosphingobium cyanobacteriorum]
MDMGFKETWPVGADSAEGLRPLSWQALCAQLVVAQDLRREAARMAATAGLVISGRHSSGSFHNPAATLLQHDEASRPGEAERVVNPMPSANGKVTGRTTEGIGESRFFPPSDKLSRRELP